MRSILLFFVILSGLGACAQQVQIIPEPVSLKVQKGFFNLSEKTQLQVSDEGENASAAFLNNYLQTIYGFSLQTVKKAENSNYITLSTRKLIKAPGKDGYSLNVSPSGIMISGDTYQGTFYGMQTLLQLLPVEPAATLKIPAVSVLDSPRFQYRGLHLDVSRHFFPVDYVKKYIDYIALHKMNYFHWHLTDDQGWRIEIKKFPRLTEVGSCRNGTIIGHHPGTGNDSTKYCGYYTQDEIRDVVKYASERYVTILPEIEMPGHALAALTTYPNLGCTGGPYKVQETWGVFDDVFCAGNDSTFSFLEGVIDEVIELFPSKYIHIGGDESPKTRWEKCPKCQKRMKDHNLKDEHELQSYFVQRMEKYINGKGRQIIGWDEILEGGLAPNAAVMSWRGEEGGIAAAKLDHEVVMTPTTYVYFDYSQSKPEDSLTIGGFLPIKKVYNYEPFPAQLPADKQRFILGTQANVWTEYITNPAKLEYMIFPRASALSEVQWSPKRKRNWEGFKKKMTTQFKRYELWKANYSKASLDAAKIAKKQ